MANSSVVPCARRPRMDSFTYADYILQVDYTIVLFDRLLLCKGIQKCAFTRDRIIVDYQI